ncbi:MAG: restriction endonuclease [Gemmatimonadetes bacterium]|nr:restriction endonuclease [Gemmatimonadota bacterium]MYK51641.1 restriction endonuclease [Gemmatimonadota bacterium]
MVRAGQGAYLIDDFRKKKIVAIGWQELGDLSNLKNKDDIKQLIDKTYDHEKPRARAIWTGQVARFRFEFRKGGFTLSSDTDKRTYLVGEIISDYRYDDKFSLPHTRDVKWLGEVDRDSLSASTRNTLGAISTIFDVGKDAQKEILDRLEGKKEALTEEEEQDDQDTLREDLFSNAHEFIKDKILELDWEEMQELVAGILRAMGYKTIVSPRGTDRGKDIQASPDGLGLEEPRIKVEVKHRSSGQMGSQEIRSFTGGLRGTDRGLYVSTGGFTKDAKYEAERSSIPIMVVDSDMLVQLVIQYYDNFDSETKTLLPLTKIYWPT